MEAVILTELAMESPSSRDAVTGKRDEEPLEDLRTLTPGFTLESLTGES